MDMKRNRDVFRPVWWLRLLPVIGRWCVIVSDHAIILHVKGHTHTLLLADAVANGRPGTLWSTVSLEHGHEAFMLRGLSQEGANRFIDAITVRRAQALVRLRQDISDDLQTLKPVADVWHEAMRGERYAAARDRERITRTIASVKERTVLARLRLRSPSTVGLPESARLQHTLDVLTPDVIQRTEAVLADYNLCFLETEYVAWRVFFDHCEERPLTEEQAKAAISGEENTLLVAAAGSGKTSTVVGRVAYVIAKGLATPDNILCLAFNSAAAREIGDRVTHRLSGMLKPDCPIPEDIKARLQAALASGAKPVCQTFHALGRDIVTRGEGIKRKISAPAESRVRLLRAIDACLEDSTFSSNWLLLQTVFRFAVPSDERFTTEQEYEIYLRGIWKQRSQKDGIQTLGSRLPVRSFEEVAIANWLALQGVPFEYERPFVEGAALLPGGLGWRPDFTYRVPTPTGEFHVVHEHFGLNAQGKAPPFFSKPAEYERQAAEKKKALEALDRRHFWTTSAEYCAGTLFARLERTLRDLDVPLRPLSREEVEVLLKKMGHAPDNELIARAVSQLRQNGWQPAQLRERISTQSEPGRAAVFLDVVCNVAAHVNALLGADRCIDYDDMIRRALGYLQENPHLVPYTFVIADEFQDTAPGRGEMIRHLLAKKPDATFFAVGDDWQAINRFAGSDLSWFTDFATKYNAREAANARYDLTRTFRSNQGIADIAKRFVLKDASQLQKDVKADDTSRQAVIDVRTWKDENEILPLVQASLERWTSNHPVPKKPSVMLLSRYSMLHTVGIEGDALEALVEQWKPYVDFVRKGNVKNDRKKDDGTALLTMHASKGLQADYVLVFGLFSIGHDLFCFPSERDDDPLLKMFLPPKGNLNDADERRLFYVALTRAKHQVVLLANEAYPSPYVIEVVTDHPSGEVVCNGSDWIPPLCPDCGTAFMVKRKKGQTGHIFLGCSRWQKRQCKRTMPLPQC